MSTDNPIPEVIDDLRNETEEQKVIFFNHVYDFLKWTLTISFGSVLWIGSLFISKQFMISQKNIPYLPIISLLSFVISIIISLGVFILIIRKLADKLELSIDHSENLKKNINLGRSINMSDQKQSEIMDRLSADHKKLLHFISSIRSLLYLQALFMVCGVLSFIGSIFLT